MDANTALTARPGTLTIAGMTFTVNQAAAVCAYWISSGNASFGRNGGSGIVNVTATPTGCAWTAVSNASWLRVNSGANGTGNGTVSYVVQKYTGKTNSRTGKILIAGFTFTVTQTR